MKYQSLKRIKKKNADYNVIMAGRDTGKSTAITGELIDEFKKYHRGFIRMIRRTNYGVAAESWFEDYSSTGTHEDENGEVQPGGLFYDGQNDITFGEYGELEAYFFNGELFGLVLYLSQATAYKSMVFPKFIYHAVFDEYIEDTQSRYLDAEITKFLSILSTVFRKRERKVWLLGNNLNDESKYNPYHRYFNIDIDRDRLKPGDIKIYKSKRFKDPAVIAFEFGQMAYEGEKEIPKADRLDGYNVGTSGDFARPYDVFLQDVEYPVQPSFLRQSIDNFYIADTTNRCYFPVVNEQMQSIDWLYSPEDLNRIGSAGDAEKYNILIQYPEYFIDQYGEDNYYKALEDVFPYEIAVPLYSNGNRYGENAEAFTSGVNDIYKGFTYRYCDSNIKFIFENIVLKYNVERL